LKSGIDKTTGCVQRLVVSEMSSMISAARSVVMRVVLRLGRSLNIGWLLDVLKAFVMIIRLWSFYHSSLMAKGVCGLLVVFLMMRLCSFYRRSLVVRELCCFLVIFLLMRLWDFYHSGLVVKELRSLLVRRLLVVFLLLGLWNFYHSSLVGGGPCGLGRRTQTRILLSMF